MTTKMSEQLDKMFTTMEIENSKGVKVVLTDYGRELYEKAPEFVEAALSHYVIVVCRNIRTNGYTLKFENLDGGNTYRRYLAIVMNYSIPHKFTKFPLELYEYDTQDYDVEASHAYQFNPFEGVVVTPTLFPIEDN